MRVVVLVMLAGCGRLGFTESHDVADAPPDLVDGDVCAPAATADWALWPMPNTRDAGLPHQPSYAPSETTVTDNVTGLVWQRDVPSAMVSAADADAYCDQLVLDGQCDWRLPHRIELISIVAYVAAGPAADPTAFPATPGEKHWTATTDSSAPAQHWWVDFTDGLADTADAAELHRVRCVRGGGSAPDMRYTVTPNTVTDTLTGLTWQRAVDAGNYNFADAMNMCSALNLGGTGWRMPSVGELQTLVDSRFNGPAVDPVAFPSAPIDLFWTGSLRANATTDGWTVNFSRGFGFRDTATGLRARCVR